MGRSALAYGLYFAHLLLLLSFGCSFFVCFKTFVQTLAPYTHTYKCTYTHTPTQIYYELIRSVFFRFSFIQFTSRKSHVFQRIRISLHRILVVNVTQRKTLSHSPPSLTIFVSKLFAN